MPLTGNHLLDSCSDGLKQTLLSAATRVILPQHKPLHTPDAMPSSLYFITEGLASLVVTMQDGRTAEVFMCGKDGLVGSYALLGDQPCTATAFMQVPGSGLRVPFALMQRCFDDCEEFRKLVLRWTQMAAYVSLQTSACGLVHEAEARLARWLLMSSDRTECETMQLTQEFLAEMLGTQRTTVAVIAGSLRAKGLIDYQRGRVAITNRAGLRAVACECYEVSRRVMDNVRGPLLQLVSGNGQRELVAQR